MQGNSQDNPHLQILHLHPLPEYQQIGVYHIYLVFCLFNTENINSVFPLFIDSYHQILADNHQILGLPALHGGLSLTSCL